MDYAELKTSAFAAGGPQIGLSIHRDPRQLNITDTSA